MPDSTTERKRLGAYYTEADTADAIVRLALERADQRVLDPCFGGCAFLEAVRNRMSSLGSSRPMRNVFGVDIDRGARKYLESVRGAHAQQFLFEDFLRVEPDVFGISFDVVLGNPPSCGTICCQRRRFPERRQAFHLLTFRRPPIRGSISFIIHCDF